ncbi:MAG: hypothetical protein K2Q18_08055 [Bdellovibrionales bacterium]|nr:hypothetical protein [Bdellovibrionales bacterium]
MEKSSNIFIKIDDFIFKKLDLLKTDGAFQKFNDALSVLDEQKQKLIAQITTFILILAPFTVAVFLWWGNFQTKKDLDVKKQIIDQIALYEGNQSALSNVSANYLAPSAIIGQDDLDNKVRNILSQNGIEQEKVTISNFVQSSISSNVSRAEATVSFNNFGTSDFSNFMRNIVETERFKVTKINLVKNKADNLLQGSIALIHIGQSAVAPEGE